MTASASSEFWQVGEERLDEYVALGHRRQRFFPHRIYRLPKCGPDGFTLAQRMCGKDDPERMREIVLYAEPPVLTEFPPDLFFDDELVWHQQQLGLPGQVACANLVLAGSTVNSITLVSDLVQRISRRREHKTRIEKRFDGWCHMLLNAVLSFADEQRATRVRIPTAALARRHTDRARVVGLGLFERVYDRTVNDLFPTRRDGEWWEVDVAEARSRVLVPERRTEPIRRKRTICICHDIERGIGHADVDPEFARRAEQSSPGDLAAMRAIEAELSIKATYCVVGSLLAEVRDGLEGDGHALAFHSYDHRLDRDQLRRCRQVDYRLKGYRPPRSVVTAELTDRRLLFHNFEWLASSSRSLGIAAPQMRDGLVRLPIACDDYPLHTGQVSYEEWERSVVEQVSENDFTTIGLHDCYAAHWLPRYRRFLYRLREIGELRTLDEVAAEVTLCSAV